MKKWFSMASTTCLLGGSVILGATTDIGIIQMLAMALLLFGGVFMGITMTERKGYK